MQVKVFASSPLQVVCAAEFLASDICAGADQADLFVVNSVSLANARQAVETAVRCKLQFRQLGSVRQFPVLDRWRLFHAVRREVEALSEKDILAVGNPAYDLFADALGRAGRARKYVLDDGVMTIRYLAGIVAGEKNWSGLPSTLPSRLTRKFLIGTSDAPDWSRLCWFSMFADYFPQLDNVMLNDFAKLRSRQSNLSLESKVLFLGAPLASVGMYEEETYDRICRKTATLLRNRYPDCELVYLCHRSEGDAESTARSRFDSIEVSSGPVELRWLEPGEHRPVAIAGVMSSALFSLREILPSSTKVHAFWPDETYPVKAAGRDPSSLRPVFEQSANLGKISLEVVSSF
ncbi:MAG: hypothetical protein KY410_01735 [Proteobacteria bacterium]|nr:hypothetical protein [Pseudomonadota bacterium]